MENNQISSETSKMPPSRGKKPYRTPKLVNYGDVRDLTLAPSPGFTESGRGKGFRPKTGMSG